MLNRLRTRLSVLVAVSLAIVFVGTVLGLGMSSKTQESLAMDSLIDSAIVDGASMPDTETVLEMGDDLDGDGRIDADRKSRNYVFDTEFAQVTFNPDGDVTGITLTNTETLNPANAIEYAKAAMDGDVRGWVDDIKYKRVESKKSTRVYLARCPLIRQLATSNLWRSIEILFAVLLVIMVISLYLLGKALEPAEKAYEAQRRFVTDASHELKTPLAIAVADLDLLELEKGESKWLEGIRTEHRHLANLIARLTELSRMDEGSYELNLSDVDLSEMAQMYAEEFEAVAQEREIAVESAIERSCVVKADESKLKMLFFILMDNAVKYCDDGGVIAVRLERQPLHTVLEVSNTYANHADVDLSRVFERFYRSDSARANQQGNGIGLSIASSIAEIHGGKLTASANPEANAIAFKLKL